MKWFWIRVGPKSNGSCPCNKNSLGHRDLHERRMPCEDWGKDWRVSSTNHRTSTTAQRESPRERLGTDSASESQKKLVLLTPSFLDFNPPALRENKYLLFWATQFVVICYGTPIKLMWFPIIFITKIPQASLTFGQVKRHTGSHNSFNWELLTLSDARYSGPLERFPLPHNPNLVFWAPPGRVSCLCTDVCPQQTFPWLLWVSLFACVCMCTQVLQLYLTHLWPYGLQPTRLLFPWDFPIKNTGVGCHFLLQGIFLTQGLRPCLCFSCIAGRFFTIWSTGETPLPVLSLKNWRCQIFWESVTLEEGNPLKLLCVSLR